MLDLGHLATDTRCDVQIFGGPSTVTQAQWHTWIKPRGCSMAYMVCIGGGAGGGGGFTAAASATRGGGGSGGGSGVARLLVPLILLPDRLFIQVGVGGQGVGSGGGTAGSGLISYVAVAISLATPQTVQNQNVLISSCTAGPTGGGTGTGAAVGPAGGTATASSSTTSAYANWIGAGTIFLAGVAGVSGGAVGGANGSAASIPTGATVPIWQGTGGGGTSAADFAGGAFSATADAYISELRPATPAAGSFNGSGGVTYWKPFFSFGGGGGSSSNTGIGGNGGKGGIGAGGGGGGGGTTGGRGGDGGDGAVIIVSW